MKRKLFVLMAGLFFGSISFAAKDAVKKDAASPSVKIKAPLKAENFDSQLVEGQIYRPDLSVVTGDTDANSFGVIRLRTNFEDYAKRDKGEAIKSEAIK